MSFTKSVLLRKIGGGKFVAVFEAWTHEGTATVIVVFCSVATIPSDLAGMFCLRVVHKVTIKIPARGYSHCRCGFG